MLSKNNNRELQRRIDDRQDRFTLRKLSIGVASVLLGSFIMGTQLSQTAYASDTHATKEVTETTTPTSLETSNISLNQVPSTSANANSQVSPASDKTLVASSESPVSSAAEPASNNQASSVATTNNNSGSAEVLAATSGATQTPTPAPTSSGYSVAMPAPSYATGYNESNVPLDPNTAHQTVQSFIVASSVDNPGENAQKGLNNLYAYSISQADVNGTGLPSQFYFMKFNSDGTLAKTVVVPTNAPGGSVYKIDDYAQITVIKFQNQPASFQLGKQIDDTNRFMPIYNAFNNQVGQGAWGSAPEIPVPSWTTQTTTYKDQNGNVIRPPYTQYGWTMSDFTTEPVQVPGYDVRATPNYVEGQYDNNIPASQKNGQITQGTVYQQGDEIDTVQVGSKRTVYVQAKIIDDKGTVQIRSWMTYAKEAGTFDPNSSNANDKGRTAAVLPPADYDFETNPNGYKIYNNSDMVVGGGAVGNQQQAARNQAGFNGQVAFQQVRFVYTNPAEQTPPAIGDNARNNAPIDTIIYPNYKEYPDGGYPAGSVRYANAQDYVILPYGTFTWGGYDTASSVTITNPVVFPSDVNYVYWTQTATITYIDDTTGKVLHTDNINGQINSTSKYSPNSDQYSGSSTIGYDNPRTTKTIGDYEKEGYVLVSTNFPTNGVVFNTPNTPQSYEIHFVEGAQEITPNTPADQVPTGTPDDAQPSALSKDVTLKVNYVNSDGTKFTGTIPSNADQSVNFTGTAYVSKVTGQLVNTKEENGQLVVDSSNTNTPKITWTPSTGSFNEVVSPVEQGYYLKSISSNQNGNNVGPITGLTHNSNDMTVTVTYAPLGHIIPVGPDNQPIPDAPQPQFPNNPDNPAEGNPGNKPDVPNWTPTEPGTTVSPNPNDPGANVNVPYTQDQGSITVTVHDVTDNVNLPQYGKSSGEQDVGTTFTYDKNTVITDLENKGYKVLNPDVVIPTTISKGAQNIVINVAHQLVPVTPENPGTPGQPINPNDPDGPKWPDGTAKNDLEVTGTQTIHYEGAGDNTPADNTQHFTFTKSATVDKVTGKIVSETGWNVASHTFGNVDTPVVPGYHADKAVAGGATITPDDLNKTIVVTYAPNGHVIPVGPDGTPIPGADQPQFPTNPDNPTGTTPSEVPVVPGYHPETGKPGDPVDPVPGKPGENVPVKYVPDNPTPETYNGSQTIKFVDGDGTELHAPDIQTADKLTGDHTFGKINTPVIKGYTTTQTTAGGATVTKDNPNATITVTYTPNGHIIPVGPDGKPIPDALQPQFPTNPDNPSETTPGQVPDVPGYHPETGKPGDPVDPVPGKPGEDVPVKYVPDTPTPETYTGSQTIKFVDGTTGKEIESPNVQTATDLTGDHTFGKINTPVIKGYTTTQTTAGGATVTKTDPNATITVTYTPNGHIIPVGPDGNPIPGADQPQFPTNPDNPSETTPGQVPVVPGYHPETGKPGDPIDPVPGQPGEDVPVKYVPDTPTPETYTGSQTIKFVDGNGTELHAPDIQTAGDLTGDHTFGKINTPVIKGYTTTQTTAGGATVTKTDPNATITVTYTPNGHIIPVGPDGTPIPGADQPQFPTNPDNPSETTPGQVPDVPGYHPETGKPGDPVDPVPGQPGENVPVKYVPDTPTPETYTGSQMIKFVDGTTGKEIETPNVQTAPDLTGDHTFGKINTPVIKGYTTTQTTAGGATVTKNNPNATITVTYTPNGHIIPVGPDGNPIPGADQPQFPTNPDNPSETTPGQVPVVPGYHPETGKPGDPVDPVPGQPGEDVPVKYVPDTPTPETYTGSQTIKFVDGTTGKEIETPNVQTAPDLTGDHTFGKINTPVIKGYTTPQTTAGGATVTKTDPNATITVTYTPNGHIIPVGPDGTPIPGADQPQFPTNPDNPSETTPGQVPDVPGYHPETGKPGEPVNPVPGKPGEDVPVKYVPDTPVEQGSITVTVRDTTDNVDLPQYGKSSGEENVGTTFTYDKNTVIQELEDKGYKVLNPNVVIPTTISKGAQNIVINVEHQLVPVTPENPGQPGQPINPNDPNGPKWPDGTAKNDLEATGTQTIRYVGAGDQTPANNVQHFTFTKSAVVDKVTGKIVSETGWNVASHTFGNIDTPVVPGYHADKAVAGGTTITPDDLNKTVTVTYTPNGHIIPVGPDGKPLPNVPQPQYPTNPNNPTEVTPNEPVPEIPGYTPNVSTVTPENPGENTPVVYTPNEKPVEPTTPSENGTPNGNTGNPTTPQPETPAKPTTPTTTPAGNGNIPTNGQTTSPAGSSVTTSNVNNANAITPAAQKQAAQLPQTGNEQLKHEGILGLLALGVAGLLAFGKKRRKE